MYIICKTLPAYKFEDILTMPYVLKELLYQLILNDYGTNDDSNDDSYIDIDTAEIDQIEKILGAYKK